MINSPATSRFLAILLGALGLLSVGPRMQATTINWGTYISPTSYLFDSKGNNLDDTYVFEVGSFGTTFTPDQTNMSQWLANWKPFDRAYAPSTNGWNSAIGTVAHSATLETDFTTSNTALSQANTFAQGEQAYIWIYKDTGGTFTPTFSSDLQWALVTNNSSDGVVADDWTFPLPSGHVATSLDWRIEDATASAFGGLNDNQGPGSYGTTPSPFILQTHTLSAVPEPGSALLIGLAGLALRLRRQKSRRV